MSEVVPFPSRPDPVERSPYDAWIDARFPDGDIRMNPPIALFFASTGKPNAWTSHVPDGTGPEVERVDVYMRRRWRKEDATLDIGNVTIAGDDAVGGWDDARLAKLRDALSDVEMSAKDAGYTAIAVTDVYDTVRPVYEALGYADAPDCRPGEIAMLKRVA